MGLIKFITVFDDEKQKVFTDSILERYNISAYPTVYFSDNKPFFDGLNTDSEKYVRTRDTNLIVPPQIPSKVFHRAFLNAYNDGYFAVVVVCPHGKWFPYYKEAVSAAKKLKRSSKIDFSLFRISVIDSKSFAAGVMLHTLSMARHYAINHCPSELVIDYGRKASAKSNTYILSKSAGVFGATDGELVAYRSHGYRFESVQISQSHDFVKYDNFADTVCKQIKKTCGRYAISLGANCDFAGNVIGRIEEKTGILPVCVMQYGIASVDVLGDKSICINIFK